MTLSSKLSLTTLEETTKSLVFKRKSTRLRTRVCWLSSRRRTKRWNRSIENSMKLKYRSKSRLSLRLRRTQALILISHRLDLSSRWKRNLQRLSSLRQNYNSVKTICKLYKGKQLFRRALKSLTRSLRTPRLIFLLSRSTNSQKSSSHALNSYKPSCSS